MTDLEPVRVIQLHLLRHAHAGDYATWDGPDEARPLTPRGERQAEPETRPGDHGTHG